MAARAPACPAHALVALALPILATLYTASGDQFPCNRDGLYADYETECREYVRCAGGDVAGRYACGSGRAFSESAGACVPRRRQPCVRRECAPGDTLAYATPGTACRRFYRCQNGTAVDHACPSGAWFDLDRQACARGAGTCYEPLCLGLPDGRFPDASHECRRTLECRGGEVREVASCGGPCAAACPAARSAAIPLPAGDADFCPDAACASLCHQAADGAYADRAAACREYFVCEARRVIRRGVCEPGLIFFEGGCAPAGGRAACEPPARSPCSNRPDGLHRDWRDCASWYDCRRERVVARGSCDRGLAFDGAACGPAAAFACAGPEPAAQCEGLPSGTYQDPASNCTRYFHCEGSLRTLLACPAGEAFDGARCAAGATALCPSLRRDSCYGRADGRYRSPDGCRGYYACYGGEKAVYACPAGHMFDGESCVRAEPGLCPVQDDSCAGLTDGYHAETESGCYRYFYCEGGDRLATFSCRGGKIFDGQACVPADQHRCGAPPEGLMEPEAPAHYCQKNGFFLQPNTQCQSYYFCVRGERTVLKCPEEQVFNGQVCVSEKEFSCPG